MAKITISQDGKLVVPNNPTIPFIEGDGIGQDIWPNVKKILDVAIETSYQGSKKIEWLEVLAGEKSFNKLQTWLPSETMDAFKEYLVGIKGPLTTPVGGGIRSLNVALRQELDLFSCVRPVRWFKGVYSPIIYPEKVNMTIFRENTEDIYAGIEWDVNTPEIKKVLNFLQNEMGVKKIRFPDTSAIGIKPVSQEGSTRLVRSAIEYAIQQGCNRLTIVHKGNIMKFTEGGFKKWGYELLETEFADYVFTVNQYNKIKEEAGSDAANQALKTAQDTSKIYVDDVICDAFLQNTLLTPEKYQVIATLNLNGDYVSDQLAAMVGGIGIAPGGNINYLTGHAIFEATHGTAPLIAGQNKANPCSMLLSGVMLLEYLGWNEAADKITQALEKLFSQGIATGDLASYMPNGKPQSTTDFSNHVIEVLQQG